MRVGIRRAGSVRRIARPSRWSSRGKRHDVDHWRAKSPIACGSCGRSIADGQAYALTRTKSVRCEPCGAALDVLCVGESMCPYPKPERVYETPSLMPPPPQAQPFASVRDLAGKARHDFKARQMKEAS